MLVLEESICHFHPFAQCHISTSNCTPLYTLLTRTGIKHVFECGSERKSVKQAGIIEASEDLPLVFALTFTPQRLGCVSKLCEKMVLSPLPFSADMSTFRQVYSRLTGEEHLCKARKIALSLWGAVLQLVRGTHFDLRVPVVYSKPVLHAYGPNEKYVNLVRRGMKYASSPRRVFVLDKEAYKVITSGELHFLLRFDNYFSWKAEGKPIRDFFSLWFETEKSENGLKILWTKPREGVRTVAREKPLWFLASLLGLKKVSEVNGLEDMLYYSLSRRNSSSSRIELRKDAFLVSGLVEFSDMPIATVYGSLVPIGSERFLTIVGSKDTACAEDVTAVFGPCEGRASTKCLEGEEREAITAGYELLFGECNKKGIMKIGNCETYFDYVLRVFYRQ